MSTLKPNQLEPRSELGPGGEAGAPSTDQTRDHSSDRTPPNGTDVRKLRTLSRLDQIREHLRRQLSCHPFPSGERDLIADELAIMNILVKAEREGRANLSAVFHPTSASTSQDRSEHWIG